MADVSPRTFFNYFDGKDSAVMGLRHVEISDESVADYVANHTGDDLVGSVVHLLFGVMDAPLSRPTIREDRLEIVRRYPQLLGGHLAQMTLMTGRLSEAVRGLLAREPRFCALTAAEQAAHADLILAMCGGAVRVSMREWAQSGRGAADDDLEQRAIWLVKEMVGKLG